MTVDTRCIDIFINDLCVCKHFHFDLRVCACSKVACDSFIVISKYDHDDDDDDDDES